MNYYLSITNEKINILGATSGDTGAAAIEGFKNTQNCRILFCILITEYQKYRKNL